MYQRSSCMRVDQRDKLAGDFDGLGGQGGEAKAAGTSLAAGGGPLRAQGGESSCRVSRWHGVLQRKRRRSESREKASLRVDSTPFARRPRVQFLKRQAVTR